MSFGIYVHIPYCIQRCHYCDFATYERSRILPPEEYVQWLCEEIRQRHHGVSPRVLDTIYFGGGTPSLLPAELIVSILDELEKHGFKRNQDTEITIEINPATIDPEKIRIYKDAGINRFSVGAQSFNDQLLKKLGREHDVKDTLNTLELLKKEDLNFTFDILFALPNQSKDHLSRDLEVVKKFQPSHISAYCLTLTSDHPLNRNRPPDDTQIEMFDLIEDALTDQGYSRYEISNFAIPGYESRHNLLYWTDQPFWGVGLSAHSYLPIGEWGSRFWNHSSMKLYLDQIKSAEGRSFPFLLDSLEENQFESLLCHQSLTDFCHTALRLSKGLVLADLNSKFGETIGSLAKQRLQKLIEGGLVEIEQDCYRLTRNGRLLSNRAFEEMTFLAEDLEQV